MTLVVGLLFDIPLCWIEDTFQAVNTTPSIVAYLLLSTGVIFIFVVIWTVLEIFISQRERETQK